jgi:hypothetical protein
MRLMHMIAACAGAAMLSAVSHADIIGPFHLMATGQAEIEDDIITKTSLNVMDQDPALGFQTVDVTLSLDDPDQPQSLLGSISIAGDDGWLYADIVSGMIFGLDTNFATAAGEFIITGGTGVFDGAMGSGTFNSFTNTQTGQTQIKLGAVLVPTPGALALLGVAGLCGRTRRRRRNAG